MTKPLTYSGKRIKVGPATVVVEPPPVVAPFVVGTSVIGGGQQVS